MNTYGFNPLNSRLFLLSIVQESHEYVNILELIYLEMPALNIRWNYTHYGVPKVPNSITFIWL